MPASQPVSVSVEDQSDIAFAKRVSTLKIRVRNDSKRILSRVYLSPPLLYREKREVKGRYGGLQLMWGGGVARGCLVMLPGDRTELRPGEEGVAYFLMYPERRGLGEVRIPLEVYVGNRNVGRVNIRVNVLRGGLRARVYRPRYAPLIQDSMLPLVRKVIEEYGVPEVESRVWPLDVSTGALHPRVEVFFEGKRIAVITGDVGSGFMHVSRIKVITNVYVAEAPSPGDGRRWYWVVRTWFFWLDKSIFDEVPDAERVELWVNPDTERVDWLVTDAHWREVAYRGPVDYARVIIVGGVHKTLRSRLVGLIRSYHPPKARNMKLFMVSPDSRDPRQKALTLQLL